MKLNFLMAAALLVGTATAATAQTMPTGTTNSGALNQTSAPLPNPANPTTNPGTLDQRTPTMSNPTQTSVGTMDRTPAVESRTTIEAQRRTSTMTTTEPQRTRTTTTKRSTRKANMPRSTSPIKE
ncbi:hypothetical protein D0N36_00220 [Hymenobacter lapidiphilus]|uniref:hypothetical protein n=1 Tax=Hymenobacter sp. CCM 8763 TaxID=2303334 RepID=UPI000E34B8BD|nr:hypothetical protein [Hymenobacter sp. CCM 8763]RFP66953.1 hypothetical protein D0N36_00220 [Hymenobacter sp. CCM 8763]